MLESSNGASRKWGYMVGWFSVQNSTLKVRGLFKLLLLHHTASRVPVTRPSRGQGAGINFSDSSLVSKIAAGWGSQWSKGRKSFWHMFLLRADLTTRIRDSAQAGVGNGVGDGIRGFRGGAVVESACSCMRQEMRVWSLSWVDPAEKHLATHARILVWKIPRPEEPGRDVVKSQTWLSDWSWRMSRGTEVGNETQTCIKSCQALCFRRSHLKENYLSAPDLSCSMWDPVSWPGVKPGPLAWKYRVLEATKEVILISSHRSAFSKCLWTYLWASVKTL